MIGRPAHADYLAQMAGKLEGETLIRLVRHKDFGFRDDQAGRLRLEAELDDLERYARLRDYAETRIVSHGPYGEGRGSFLRDLLSTQLGVVDANSPDAVDRLREHDELFGRAQRSIGTSSLGALIPELSAQAEASGRPYSGRPFVDALVAGGAGVPFPESGITFSVPVSATQGISAFSQTSQNGALGSSDAQYVNRTVTTSTAAVGVEMSRQALERMGPTSEAHLLRVIRRSLDHELERQVFNGTAAHELAGLIPAGTVVQANTATGVSITARTLEGSRLVGDAMSAPATVAGVAPRRWDWLSFQASVTAIDSLEFGTEPYVGSVRVVRSGGVPLTVSSNQDRVVVCRPDSVVFTEDAPRIRVAQAPTAPGLITIIASQYAGLVTRHATFVSVVSGVGLAAPAAFTA
jgi:hypothetical protein